mgnify:CR=1 FL=1
MPMELREKLNPKHTALIVIDVQVDFASPDGFLAVNRGRDLSMMEGTIDRIQKTVEDAKKAGILTLYIQEVYDRSRLSELQREQYDLDGRLEVCDKAGDGWKFYRIDPPQEFVIQKVAHSAFSNPELHKRLIAHGVKTLVLTGMDSYTCVETTIRDGSDLGYKIVVPSDLVAGNAAHMDWHERMLAMVKNTYGVVVNSRDLQKIWEEYQS